MASSGTGSIAKRWRELQGEHSWKGLLDPLDMDLRKSIISYGELVQAAAFGLNKEKRSPHAGACMYGYDDLLTSSGVAGASHYKVTKFLYATAESVCHTLPLFDTSFVQPLKDARPSKESITTFMGYVAVATDEGVAALGRRDIVVAWHGSLTIPEWRSDMDFMPAFAAQVLGSAALLHPFAAVHRGFLSLYMASNAGSEFSKASAREQVLEEVRRLMELHKDEVTSITTTGHSLGCALATLNAVDIVANGVNAAADSSQPRCPVTAILFASPRVGDIFFKAAFDSFSDLRALQVRNNKDLVPMLPPWLPADIAVPLHIDTTLSPYLKVVKDPMEELLNLHNLQCYLHGVAGAQGSAGGFKLEVDRDVALVNMDADALKDEYPVPASWWVVQNKCMVKNAQGKWELKDFNK